MRKAGRKEYGRKQRIERRKTKEESNTGKREGEKEERAGDEKGRRKVKSDGLNRTQEAGGIKARVQEAGREEREERRKEGMKEG